MANEIANDIKRKNKLNKILARILQALNKYGKPDRISHRVCHGCAEEREVCVTDNCGGGRGALRAR